MSDNETEGWMKAIARTGAESRGQSGEASSLAPVAGSACLGCGSERDPVDICDRCHREFGDLCKHDGNGYNCTCQHCGNNTYDTLCPDCDRSILQEDDIPPNKSALLSMVKETINHRISPWEVVGDPAWDAHNGEWRVTFALKPSGPLILGAFKLSVIGDAPNTEVSGGPSEGTDRRAGP